MRLNISVKLPKPVEQCFSVAAAAVVVMSDGGSWLDGGTPIDPAPLRRCLEDLDPELRSAGDDLEQLAVRAGTIDWLNHTVDVHAEHPRLRVIGHVTFGQVAGADETLLRARLRLRAHRPAIRLFTLLGGPLVRATTRRVVARHATEWAEKVRTAPAPKLVPHRAADWRFEPAQQ